MSDKLDLILKELQTQNQRMGNMEQRMGNMEQRMGNMEQRMGNMEQRIENIEQRIEKIEFEQKHQDDLLVQLIAIVKTTNEKVSDIQADVASLKDSQQTMVKIQQEQQKILERLSIRSISHEAEIAELRRIK